MHFTDDELSKIDCALTGYIDTRSKELSQQNSRDEDWNKLLDYQTISRKISDYIIEQSQSCID
jgi:hypothetical protein